MALFLNRTCSAFSIVIDFDMAKKHYLLFIYVALFSSVGVFAQGREYFAYPVQHRYGFYVNGAYDMMLPIGMSSLSLGNGYDAAFGVIYEYNNKHLIINAGIGFALESSKIKLKNTITEASYNEKDAEGKTFTLNTEFTRTDRLRLGMLDIPIHVGQTVGKFYYMGGARFGIKIFDKSSVNGTIANSGTYDRYLETFQGIAESGFRKVKFSSKVQTLLTCNMRLSAEGGINLHSFNRENFIINTRLGMFINMGVFLPTVAHNDILFNMPKGESPYNIRSYQYTSVFKEGKKLVGDVQLGMKFTVLLMDKRRNEGCRTCAKPFEKTLMETRCIACEEQDRRRAVKVVPKKTVEASGIQKQMQANEEAARPKKSKETNNIWKKMLFREDHRR